MKKRIFQKKNEKKRVFNLIDDGYRNILNVFSKISSQKPKKTSTFLLTYSDNLARSNK